MAQYTYRMNHRPITDFTGITAWLEKLARKGWMLDFCGTVFWKFRKEDPRKVHYSVIYLPMDCNAFSPARTVEAEELEELCAGTGWRWVSSMYQMQVFANEEENPAPLDSDPVVQVDSLHRAMMQNILPGRVLTMLLCAVFALLCWSSLFSGSIHFGNRLNQIFAGGLYSTLLLMEFGDLIGYFIWHKRAVADAQQGLLRPSRSIPAISWGITLLTLAAFFLWVGMRNWREQITVFSNLGMFILVRAAAGFARKNEKLESMVNLGVMLFLAFWVLLFPFVSTAIGTQIETSQHTPAVTVEVDGKNYTLNRDEIPLRTEDLMEIDPNLQNYYCETESYFPCRITKNTQHHLHGATDTPRLYYVIWDYPLPLYRDYFLQEAMNEKFYPTHVELDAEAWEAQAVYRLCQDGQPQNVYVICWEGRIVSLSIRLDTTNPELTTEQIATIVEKLKP